MATSNIFCILYYYCAQLSTSVQCLPDCRAWSSPDLTRDLRLFSVRGLNGATILLSHFYFQPKCCCIEGKSKVDNTMLEIKKYIYLYLVDVG